MHEKDIYVTIDHLYDLGGISNVRTGDVLKMRKDPGNSFDDEAIAVYDGNDIKIGYVANSTDTVARGTYSAGRVYDLIKDETSCTVRFILGDMMISRIDGVKD